MKRGAGITRRGLLGGLGGSLALSLLAPVRSKTARPSSKKAGPRVVVVGAGAFGGWTALSLLRRGAKVTLVDAWGPGNSRSSSGGETRVIRGVYGPRAVYVGMVARAFRLWRENELRWKRRLYRRTGALWMVTNEGEFVRDSLPILKDNGLAYEELSPEEAAKRYPQISFGGVQWALFEKEAGYLLARQACAAVVEGFVSEGGEYREARAMPGVVENGSLASVDLADGTILTADAYVFACGPWMPQVLNRAIGPWIMATRQEVFFFGTPAGDARFSEEKMPVWVEFPRMLYGVPGNKRRGFKIADDARGQQFEPTGGDRIASLEGVKAARRYLAMRFPSLDGAPLVESRVCQYEDTPDRNFIVDRNPEAKNMWMVGGGSGHGFKHGPAVGELAASNILEEKPVEPLFSYARLKKWPRLDAPGGAA